MLTRSLLLTVVALLVSAAPANATIVPGKGMAGVTLGQCQERVIQIAAPSHARNGSRSAGWAR
jgi:hypothetical protein